MRAIIGTCGNCGGPVIAGQYANGILGMYCCPQPTCKKCGATTAGFWGPVLEMHDRRKEARK